ncbi:hypothetical protein C8Q72DRAFT_859203 [Fomitopsis betulina]|nr:hypothetical protein C8Q72DRAFT_859203 [Fomitopsis betulina]
MTWSPASESPNYQLITMLQFPPRIRRRRGGHLLERVLATWLSFLHDHPSALAAHNVTLSSNITTMRFMATFTVLAAALVVAPPALAMPANFGSAADLKARGAPWALYVRNNDKPPAYDRHDPIRGQKPRYERHDKNPPPSEPPKYRQKNPYKPPAQKLERNGGASSGLWHRPDLQW